VAAAGNVEFALLQALASSTLIYYISEEGISRSMERQPLYLTVLFDGDLGGLRLFLSKVQHRANQFGWLAILQITQGGVAYNSIEHYTSATGFQDRTSLL
jgi:hypothetical protein